MKQSDGRRLYARDEKLSSRWLKPLGGVWGVLLTAAGIWIGSAYAAAVGVLLFAASLLNKAVYVTEEGVHLSYRLLMFRHEEVWRFSNIRSIHQEPFPGKGCTALYIEREMMSRRFLFPDDSAGEVLALARMSNGSIQFGEVRPVAQGG